MGNRFRAWAPAIVWAAVLFLLSAVHDPGSIVRVPVSDKVVHGFLYLVLGGALAHARGRSPGWKGHLLLLAIGAAYGASDEWHQMFVPGRTPDVLDWMADIVGLLAGYGMTVVITSGTETDTETDEGSSR